MFNRDFYPTSLDTIDKMLAGEQIEGMVCYDPEGGKGDIVDYLVSHGASQVISSELNPDLRKILQTKCQVIGDDFLKIESHQVSHVNLIVMNPPFSDGVNHINHAFKIAPDGCKIVSLGNSQWVKNDYSKSREELKTLIKTYGDHSNLGNVFSKAERETDVDIILIRIQKPGGNYEQEFSGFFLEDEEEASTGAGLMPYNTVRDLVNRYVESIKIFDQQLETAAKLNEMAKGYFDTGKPDLSISINRLSVPIKRNEFKKSMQKDGWNFIFSKMNMNKYATKGLKEDINKFVETQQDIPFTMRNIYKMLDVVIGTQGQRMDKAIIEVFDKVTRHHNDNRYNIEGWKTNSHCLLTKRFIMPTLTTVGWGGSVDVNHSSNFEMVEDLVKALCYITGDNYSDMISLSDFIQYPYLLVKDGKYLNDPTYDFDVKIKDKVCDPERSGNISRIHQITFGSEIQHNEVMWGKWFEWGFFKCRAYKKGTMHFEFKDEKTWGLFNQRVAKIKGYPLHEKKERTEYQKRNEGFGVNRDKKKKKVTVLATIKI